MLPYSGNTWDSRSQGNTQQQYCGAQVCSAAAAQLCWGHIYLLFGAKSLRMVHRKQGGWLLFSWKANRHPCQKIKSVSLDRSQIKAPHLISSGLLLSNKFIVFVPMATLGILTFLLLFPDVFPPFCPFIVRWNEERVTLPKKPEGNRVCVSLTDHWGQAFLPPTLLSANCWIYCPSCTAAGCPTSQVCQWQAGLWQWAFSARASGPVQTPAARAFTELHLANSSSVLFLTALAPANPKPSPTGLDTDASWGSSDQLVHFYGAVTGSCENPLPCAWKGHSDKLQHCQSRGHPWHIEHPTVLKEIVHNCSASLVTSTACSPEETALSVLELEGNLEDSCCRALSWVTTNAAIALPGQVLT